MIHKRIECCQSQRSCSARHGHHTSSSSSEQSANQPYGPHLTGGETKTQRCQVLPEVLRLVSDVGLLDSEGLLPRATLRATRMGRFHFSCQDSDTEAAILLHTVVLQEPKPSWDIHRAFMPDLYCSTGPCQKALQFVLQVWVMTPPLVREWPSVLHHQL